MSVDRLALVSKVLLDVRFLELKRENERLKLSLFWVDHGISALRRFMGFANNRASGPRCRCSGCMHARRSRPTILDGYDDEVRDEACKFVPWFEQTLQEHGLSFSAKYEGTFIDYKPDRELYPKVHADVHFFLFATNYDPPTAWVSWTYAAKLWKAETTEDPELLKLKAFFEAMSYASASDISQESDSDS